MRQHKIPRSIQVAIRCCLTVVAVLGPLSWTCTCRAALGPENVFLVVNSLSWSSCTVANHYVHLRRIPANNVFALDWPGSVIEVNAADFRQWILEPVLSEIRRRGLEDQIQCIAYSSDFPYAVSFERDVGPNGAGRSGNGTPQPFPVGSITGLTYHYQDVLASRTDYALPDANPYATIDLNRNATHDFATFRQSGGGAGQTMRPYMLSVMLGYTSGRGNGLDEVVRGLTRSRFADGVSPDGTIYFMNNSDVRTQTRRGRFDVAVAALQKEGIKSQVMDGSLPQRQADILGLMSGVSRFDWVNSGSQIVPGAICDNLTSFGGILDESAKQSPLSEMIRWGAAGTTGTVVEPFAIAAKFPDPVMHVHYVRGLTLAESVYASVRNPYQLLVVGDPLCRPFAADPLIHVDGLSAGQPVDGILVIAPRSLGSAAEQESARIRFDLFMDGRRLATCGARQSFQVNTSVLSPGYHEAVIQLSGPGPNRVSSRRQIPFVVESVDKELICEGPSHPVQRGQPVMLQVASRGVDQLLVFHGRRLVGRQPAGGDSIMLDSRQLGLGPVQLQLRGVTQAGGSIAAAPVHVTIIPSPEIPARPTGTDTPSDPFVLRKANGETVVIDSFSDPAWLKRAGVKDGEPFTLTAWLEFASTGLHQLQIVFNGSVDIRVDEMRLESETHQGFARQEFPLHLAKGHHRMQISGRVNNIALFEWRIGHRGAGIVHKEGKIH